MNDPTHEPNRMSMQRDHEVSNVHSDHEVAFFRHITVLKRHLKPLGRFLLTQVGREWAIVAPEISLRCRKVRAPSEIKDKLFELVRQQAGIGGEGTISLLFPRVVYVDEQGIIRRGDGLKK